MQFVKLLSPFQIGQVKLKNRIVKAASIVNYAADDGSITDRLKGYYETLARGGVGLIITGSTRFDYPLGVGRQVAISIYEDKFIPGLAELTHVVHAYGCPIFGQLSHSGPTHPRSKFGLQPVAASSLPEEALPEPHFGVPRELTTAEIEVIIDKWAKAAERARKAGFDGVEVHHGHNYLGNSFLSRAWNIRQDGYGCQDIKSRARFSVEVIQAIKKRVGWDFPVGIRINGREWGVTKGLTFPETQAIARILEEAGADYIHVSGYGYRDFGRAMFPEQILYPEPSEGAKPWAGIVKSGLMVPGAEAIKKVVSIPVIAVGGLTPELGEDVLRRGKADLIAFARGLHADPDMPNKLASGRPNEIRPCTHCYTCGALVGEAKPVRCRVNAAMGNEWERAIIPAEKHKRVMVVGGGPAGMEAARITALRGHEVLLYDKASKLGGLLPLAALVKGTEIEDLPALVSYFKLQITKLGVKVKLGAEVTPALVKGVGPDVVILAAGGVPDFPQIRGIDKSNVITSAELHRKAHFLLGLLGPRLLGRLTRFWLPIGKRFVIIGGSIHGCETAEFLVKRGRTGAIVEESDNLGDMMLDMHRTRLKDWLAKRGVNILTGVKYEEVTDRGLTIITKDGRSQMLEGDTIVVATPPKQNTQLGKAFEETGTKVYMIGDCRKPGLIIDAIDDGYRIGSIV